MTKEELENVLNKKCKDIDCIKCLYNRYEKCSAIMAYDILKEAGCLREEIKLPVNKTGVLKTADELVKGAIQIQFDAGFPDVTYITENQSCKRQSVTVGTEHLYKDIKEEVDYSAVPVGSIVEFTDKKLNITDVVIIEYIKNGHLHYKHGSFNISSYDLKIIRWGA